MPVCAFTVYGDAQPAGSKRAFVNKHTGRASVSDANARSKPWKALVAQVAAEEWRRPLITDPVVLTLVFVQPRPKSHYGTGANSGVVKASAPLFPATRPDVLKLARGVEDALTGIVWRDDAQIVVEHLYKVYGEPARVEVEVCPCHAIVGTFGQVANAG